MGEGKTNKSEKEDLIERILDVELDMFVNVPTDEPTKCRENLGAFRLVRGSGFEVWSHEALESYFEDLKIAVREKRNLMTLKYARMGNQIECLNNNPLIGKIVEIEKESQEQVRRKYPHLMSHDKVGTGVTYLEAELETYSDRTLELYYANVLQAKQAGRNLPEEVYSSMFKKQGFYSLKELEKAKSDSS